jgi:hypothetical protein
MTISPVALISVHRAAQATVTSALPHAPVVAEPRPRARQPRLAGTRGVLASALRRAADRVAPPVCSPAH